MTHATRSRGAGPGTPPPRRFFGTGPLAAGLIALALAGCAGAPGGAPAAAPATAHAGAQAESLYAGWRVYQQRCASCHGADATGADGVPDLTFRLRGIGAPRFVDLVLRRYDWGLPPGQKGSPRETLIDDIVARDQGAVQMPEWQGEPLVAAHIMDLYAYLTARADGKLPPGRPLR